MQYNPMTPSLENMNLPTHTDRPIEIDEHDLPLYCPHSSTPLWNYHPRVFLDISDTHSAKCPYCGNEYRLKCVQESHETASNHQKISS